MRSFMFCIHPHMGKERKLCRVLVRESEGKIYLGRPRSRWVDGIRMDLREIGWGDVGMDPVGSG
jgi:hypothetical protein